MKHIVLLFTLITTPLLSYAQTIAFPGAEGYGKYAVGGRGGIVVEVTNLNDAGSGSLRDALTGSAYRGQKRTIVFRVSGIIALNSPIKISNESGVTIAGQTAPGDGICIKNWAINVSDCNNIVIRYIRFRPGDEQDCTSCDDIDAHSYRNSYHIMLDHCSLSWSIDDVLDLTVSTGWSTVQWCFISEPLVESKHSKGAHGYIGGWDGNSLAGGTNFGGGTYHHNLLAHGGSRTPRLDKYLNNDRRDLIEIANNVIYNWNGYGAYGGEQADVNWRNNYYKYGPETDYDMRSQLFLPGDQCKAYVNGNYVYGNPSVTNDNSKGINLNSSALSMNEFLQNSPFTVIPINLEKAQDAYTATLNHGGAFLPKRDECDVRIKNDVENGTGSHIDSPSDVGGWPVFDTVAYDENFDTDHDGMPDFWEKFMDLDTNDASDRNVFNLDGYTMLEKYLNSIELDVPINNIKLTRTSENAVTLSWADNYMSEAGFILERAVNSGDFDTLVVLSKNTKTYNDYTINATDTFSYRIKIRSDLWETKYSQVHSTSGIPFSLNYIEPENNSSFPKKSNVDLYWNTSEKATNYELFTGNTSSNLTKIAVTPDTTYSLSISENDSETFWQVNAMNDSGTITGPVWKFVMTSTSATNSTFDPNVKLFPNPSNKAFTIAWNNNSPEKVSIDIFDIEGRKIAQLTNRSYRAGNHSISWDGILDKGQLIESGLYFCHIRIGNQIQVEKITRIRN